MVISHGDFFFLQLLPFPTIIFSWYIVGEGASFPSTYEGHMSTCMSTSIYFTVSSSLCYSVCWDQLLLCFILMINSSQIWPGGPLQSHSCFLLPIPVLCCVCWGGFLRVLPYFPAEDTLGSSRALLPPVPILFGCLDQTFLQGSLVPSNEEWM